VIPTLELLVAQLAQNKSVLENLLNDLRHEAKLKKHQDDWTPEKKKVTRKTVAEITESVTDVQFRRMFQMSQATFFKLCQRLGESVGDDVFKSESKTRPQIKTTQATTLHFGVGEYLERYTLLHF
jgi:hypothetical protein